MKTLLTNTAFKAGIFLVLLLTGSTAFCQQEYHYDADGNPTRDLNKGIDSIYYNHLNLVERVVVKDKGEIRYSYDALGNRLTKSVLTGEDTATRYYAGGFEYDDDRVLELINMEEGQYVTEGSLFRPVYVLEDHLGNGHVSFDENGITQVDSYYPYGARHFGLSYAGGEVENRYGFGGKERQDDLGVNWIYFGSRMYDALVAMWNGVDKQAQKYLNISPFAYVAGNPVNNFDPNGEEIGTANPTASRIIPWQVLGRETPFVRWEIKDGKKVLSKSGLDNGFEVLTKEGKPLSPPFLKLRQMNQASIDVNVHISEYVTFVNQEINQAGTLPLSQAGLGGITLPPYGTKNEGHVSSTGPDMGVYVSDYDNQKHVGRDLPHELFTHTDLFLLYFAEIKAKGSSNINPMHNFQIDPRTGRPVVDPKTGKPVENNKSIADRDATIVPQAQANIKANEEAATKAKAFRAWKGDKE